MKFTKIAALAAVAVMACGVFYGCGEATTSTPAGTTSSQAGGQSAGGQQQVTSVVGKWKIDGIVANGKTQSLADYVEDAVKAQLGDSVDTNSAEYKQVMQLFREGFDNMSYEFKDGGTFEAVTSVAGQAATQTGTYTVDGDKITYNLEAQEGVAAQSGEFKFDAAAGTLSVENQGVTLVMKKA